MTEYITGSSKDKQYTGKQTSWQHRRLPKVWVT